LITVTSLFLSTSSVLSFCYTAARATTLLELRSFAVGPCYSCMNCVYDP